MQSGELSWPQAGGALFLNARAGWPLHQQPLPGLVCEQAFKPDADALQRDGHLLAAPADDRRYPLILVLPPRQRDAMRALFALVDSEEQPIRDALGKRDMITLLALLDRAIEALDG